MDFVWNLGGGPKSSLQPSLGGPKIPCMNLVWISGARKFHAGCGGGKQGGGTQIHTKIHAGIHASQGPLVGSPGPPLAAPWVPPLGHEEGTNENKSNKKNEKSTSAICFSCNFHSGLLPGLSSRIYKFNKRIKTRGARARYDAPKLCLLIVSNARNTVKEAPGKKHE